MNDDTRIPGTDHYTEDCWCDPRVVVVPAADEDV